MIGDEGNLSRLFLPFWGLEWIKSWTPFFSFLPSMYFESIGRRFHHFFLQRTLNVLVWIPIESCAQNETTVQAIRSVNLIPIVACLCQLLLVGCYPILFQKLDLCLLTCLLVGPALIGSNRF